MLLAEGGLVDLQRPSHQGLGLAESVGVPKQRRQIVQVDRHGWVLLAEGGLVDLQRPSHQRFGFLESVGGLKQSR